MQFESNWQLKKKENLEGYDNHKEEKGFGEKMN
jgi:hypothetical protein